MAVYVVKLHKCYLIQYIQYLNSMLCPYILISLTRKGSELINRAKYCCVKDVSQTRLTHSLPLIAEGK